MISTMFINLASYILGGIIGLFPVGTGFSATIHNAFKGLGAYLGILDPLVPIATLISAVSLVIGVELAIYGFRSLKWLISHLPAVGGRG